MCCYATLRKRADDPVPNFPQIRGNLSDEPEDVIAEAIEAAVLSVGWARLNEAIATILVLNLTRLVELEYLFGPAVDFQAKTAFLAPRVVKEKPQAA